MTEVTSPIELRLRRDFAAPRQRVFEAWTNPEVLRRWWAAGPDWDTPEAEVDLRVGGAYRTTMRNADDGSRHTLEGEYLEIDPPARLVYTWNWVDEPGSPTENSRITVEFTEAEGITTVELTQTGLVSEESRANHEHGWNLCLDNLSRRVLEA